MPKSRLVSLALLLLAAGPLGCGDDDRGGGGDMDGGPPDTGAFDGGPPDTGTFDAGPPTPREGCNPETGIECDGDWAERCSPACPSGECCSPQMGRFACMPRDAMGRCPAADLFVDATQIEGMYSVEWRIFPEDDCAIVEGCVGGPGPRRLLRFSTWTPNTGDADMFLGVPDMSSSYFEYSSCHDHYHFNTYAEYELRNTDGSVAATGHKQAFCLLDFYQYPGTDDRGAVYDCGRQGIQRGWQDVYGRDLDCQWVDVTDVAPGEYLLNIQINTEHILNESNYDNNEVNVAVTIPEDVPLDPTRPCEPAVEGADRECGYAVEGMHTCTAGAMVTVGCSATCGLGTCMGDPILRVCPDDAPCELRNALAQNDDSGCGMRDFCSQTMFTCPASGRYTLLVGAYDSSATATCTIATSP